MGNGLARNASLRQNTKSALERIAVLEEEVPRIISAVNNALVQVQSQLEAMAEVQEALISRFGEDEVKATIADNRRRRAEEQAQALENALQQAVEAGDVVVAEKLGENSIIVGREYDAEGNVIPPGRVQTDFSRVRPDFKEKMLGQGIGFKLETVEGRTFEVTGVYERVEKPVVEESETVETATAETVQ